MQRIPILFTAGGLRFLLALLTSDIVSCVQDHYRQMAQHEKLQYERKKAEYEAKKLAEAAAKAAAVPQQPMVQLGSNMQQQIPMVNVGLNQMVSPQQMPVATAGFPSGMAAVLSAGQSDKVS
jgi:hypothetical protein